MLSRFDNGDTGLSSIPAMLGVDASIAGNGVTNRQALESIDTTMRAPLRARIEPSAPMPPRTSLHAVLASGIDSAAGEPDEPARSERHFRTIWISDLHLGTPGCQADALLEFLRETTSDQLYLVGDIIDGWQLRRQWYWPQAHNDVVQKLLRKARKGTRVVFVPGNHDEFARKFAGHFFGGIEVVEEAVHQTVDGRRLWIIHGDHFDGVIQCAKWLAHVGDRAYEITLRLNRSLNSVRARLGLPYWSLSRYLKLKVKRALSYIDDFECAVAREARSRGLDGVVCGHIHHAEIRQVEGVLYANDGDWVESLTALVEHADGRLELLEWPALLADGSAQKGPASAREPLADTLA